MPSETDHSDADPAPGTAVEAWRDRHWVARTQEILDSYFRLLGRELIVRTGSAEDQSRRLFEAPFVVLAHGTQADPLLDYGNRMALLLWERDRAQFITMPSRLTAEPLLRSERASLLERVSRDGFIDDYAGVRVSSTGRRFQIDRATVWNVRNARHESAGQAATFETWRELPSPPTMG